jgi:O-antigen/teichoic acid export membrane protein
MKRDGTTQKIFRSALSSGAQTVVSALLLFVLYRYLLSALGATLVGVWSIVLAATSVSRISDLGLAGSIVRFVAKFRAREDDDSVMAVILTASVSIAVALGCALLIAYPLFRWFIQRIVPAAVVEPALALVPFALASVWFTAQAGIFYSALDACQRISLRNGIAVTGSIVYLLLVLLFVPRYGLQALGYVQVLQSGSMAVISWSFVRRELPRLPLLPSRWSRSHFHDMLAYGANFQLVALANILFDFTTKALLTRFGSLSDVAYYDMASRMVLQLRLLLISANQVTVPFVTAAHETDPERVRHLYERSYVFLSFLAVPLFGALFALVPTASILWIGYQQQTFIVFAALLTVAWGLNSLNAPAYFANLATGELRWNTIGHLVIGVLNVLLGTLLGYAFGGNGVVVGWSVALVTGSAIILLKYHLDHAIPFRALFTSSQARTVTAVALAAAIDWWLLSRPSARIWGVPSVLLTFVVVGVALAAALRGDPLASSLLERLAAPGRAKLEGLS